MTAQAMGLGADSLDPAALAELAALDDGWDSDELERMEDEAEREMREEGVHVSGEDSAPSSPSDASFGPLEREEVAAILEDLRGAGLLACLRKHIIPHPDKILPVLLSLGVMMVCTSTYAAPRGLAGGGRGSVAGAAAFENGVYKDVGCVAYQTSAAPQAGARQYDPRRAWASSSVAAYCRAEWRGNLCIVRHP